MNIPFLGKKPGPPEGRRRPAQREQRPPAFSYYAQRSVPDSRRQDTSPRRMFNTSAKPPGGRSGTALARYIGQRFGLIIAMIVLLISTLHILSLSANIKVSPLSDSSNDYFLHEASTYQASAQQLFKRSVLNRNKLTFDGPGIVAAMKATYPELADVSVALPLVGNRPILYIQPTQPSLILETGDGAAYVVDNTGTALIAADSLKAGHSLPTVKDLSGLQAHLGQTVLASANVSFIRSVLLQLSAQQIAVAALTLPAGADELDVSLAGQPYFVKFNLQSGDAAQQAGTFLATAQKLARQGITPGAYIDVRVDGRAYYK